MTRAALLVLLLVVGGADAEMRECESLAHYRTACRAMRQSEADRLEQACPTACCETYETAVCKTVSREMAGPPRPLGDGCMLGSGGGRWIGRAYGEDEVSYYPTIIKGATPMCICNRVCMIKYHTDRPETARLVRSR